MTHTFISTAEPVTFTLGEALGRALLTGDFVGLVGQLGAGKTLFSRGVARGAGVDEGDVSSPTYSIVQTYRGRLTLHHGDLYRITSEDDLFATGFYDLLEGDGGAMLVEWIDQVPGAAPPDWLEVRLSVVDELTRQLLVITHGPASEALLTRWLSMAQQP